MAKIPVFLIHGMGKYDATWAKDIKTCLQSSYKKYPDLVAEYPFNSTFDVVPLRYDDIFEQDRTRAQTEFTQSLDRFKTNGATPRVLQALQSLGEQHTGDSFFHTHILDVAFYRFLFTTRRRVQVRVATQIFKHLTDNYPPSADLSWSFIAHSLGTSVIHDTLISLFKGKLPEVAAEFDVTPDDIGVRTGVFVANVSRILYKGDEDFYDTVIVPSRGRTKGVMDRYINVAHRLDPFTKPRPFEPDEDWYNPDVSRSVTRYEDIKIGAVKQANVHDLQHYLENPRVHCSIFRAFLEERNLPKKSNENAAHAKYIEEAHDGSLQGIIEDLDQLVVDPPSGLSGLFSKGTEFFKLLESF